MTVAGLFSLTAIDTPLMSPPPGRAHQHDVGHGADGLGLLHHLEAGRALAGDHVGIVEGMHVGGVARRRTARARWRRDPLDAVVGHDLAAECLGARDLQARRIGRHDDRRLEAHQRRGRRHALRVIARRAGHHAAGKGRLVHLRDLVVGAAELEGADPLQVLGLEQHAAAGHAH